MWKKAAHNAAMILETLNYPPRQVELAKIAGFLHDIGNVINRNDHAQSGAVMAFRLLDRLEMPVDEICSIISAIGNHDEGTAQPVDAISAAPDHCRQDGRSPQPRAEHRLYDFRYSRPRELCGGILQPAFQRGQKVARSGSDH